jgi:hypothetical protein
VESDDVRFMGFQCLVERAGGSRPIRENATTLQTRKGNGTLGKQLLAISFQPVYADIGFRSNAR